MRRVPVYATQGIPQSDVVRRWGKPPTPRKNATGTSSKMSRIPRLVFRLLSGAVSIVHGSAPMIDVPRNAPNDQLLPITAAARSLISLALAGEADPSLVLAILQTAIRGLQQQLSRVTHD